MSKENKEITKYDNYLISLKDEGLIAMYFFSKTSQIKAGLRYYQFDDEEIKLYIVDSSRMFQAKAHARIDP